MRIPVKLTVIKTACILPRLQHFLADIGKSKACCFQVACMRVYLHIISKQF